MYQTKMYISTFWKLQHLYSNRYDAMYTQKVNIDVIFEIPRGAWQLTIFCECIWIYTKDDSSSSSKLYFQQNTTMEQYQEKENTL